MKDEYDVIVEKTVRDLFKSTPLIQIKKYKMNKEKNQFLPFLQSN